jgi:hypothetical protein
MDRVRQLAVSIADGYAQFNNVRAVGLGGSQASRQADGESDIDLYVYATHPLTLDQRAEMAVNAKRKEIGNAFWEPGDEWVDAQTGISADIMFRNVPWIEEQISRVMHDHQASVGYSTCFVYNVATSEILFDREGWFATLQQKASGPYPPELKRAVVAKNHPILRSTISSYTHQIEKAIERNDSVSVNHRVAALLASYFDILFAMNEQLHPGEKRLVKLAQQLCPKVPAAFDEDIQQVLGFVSQAQQGLMSSIHNLLDSLDALLRSEQLI